MACLFEIVVQYLFLFSNPLMCIDVSKDSWEADEPLKGI